MTDAAAQPSVSPPPPPTPPVAPVLPTLPSVAPPASPTSGTDVVPSADVSQAERLALFEQVLSEVEASSTASSVSVEPPAPVAPVDAPASVAPPAPDQSLTPVSPPVEATIVPTGGLSVTEPVGSGVLPQALPMAVHQATDQFLNPADPGPATTAKERTQAVTPDQQAADATADVGVVQVVEQEPSPELSPEVEAYIQTVQDHAEQAPHEVVIADGSQQNAATTYPSRPVVVVPITPEIEKEGRFKSPVFSIKWLITWSHKIIKMFAGKVLYREAK